MTLHGHVIVAAEAGSVDTVTVVVQITAGAEHGATITPMVEMLAGLQDTRAKITTTCTMAMYKNFL